MLSRRRVRARLRGDRGDHRQRRRARAGLSRRPGRRHAARAMPRASCAWASAAAATSSARSPRPTLAERLGTPAVVGGLTWERRPIDPLPGPAHARRDRAAPSASTRRRRSPARTRRGPGGFRFAESRHGRRARRARPCSSTPTRGPRAVAAGLDDAAAQPRLRPASCCSTSAATSSPTATSPGWPARWPTRSCSPAAPPSRHGPGGARRVFGAGCDGELTPPRCSSASPRWRGRRRLLGAWALTRRRRAAPGGGDRRRAHRGERDGAALRPRRARRARRSASGRRTRRSSPRRRAADLLLRPGRGAALAPRGWPRAVADAADPARRPTTILPRRGVRTELAYERDAAG